MLYFPLLFLHFPSFVLAFLQVPASLLVQACTFNVHTFFLKAYFLSEATLLEYKKEQQVPALRKVFQPSTVPVVVRHLFIFDAFTSFFPKVQKFQNHVTLTIITMIGQFMKYLQKSSETSHLHPCTQKVVTTICYPIC